MLHRNLWAPWRLSYLKQLVHEQQSLGEEKPDKGCFLCDALAAPWPGDEARLRLVLQHDDRGLMILNRYPYTNGHLLIAPAEHVASLSDLTPTGRAGLMELTELGERLLRAAMHCQGINVGINLGRSAGAGIPGHLHIHLVPRWDGDTNFMQTVSGVRVIPQALEDSYAQLSDMLSRITQG
ncbi:MAG: HIT domain-containing protein [Phycisphaeraceae bacterium]|nr:HIT domain-containing protein [Phycisphaeraceae bacterium]